MAFSQTEYQRAYRETHRDEKNAYAREWRRCNPGKSKQSKRRWVEEHPEHHRRIDRRGQAIRRARERAAFVEIVDACVIYELSEGICGICNLPIDSNFEVDHITPLAVGGEHTYDNCQAAHSVCNRRKGANRG